MLSGCSTRLCWRDLLKPSVTSLGSGECENHPINKGKQLSLGSAAATSEGDSA